MKSTCAVFYLFLGAALVFSACGRGEKEEASGRARTEIVDGVVLVHNPATPTHPEKTVRFEKEISFGDSEEGPGAVFRPGAFAVDKTGRVYIADASDQAIKVFDPDGAFVRAIGRAGQGPGEFQSIAFLAFRPDGRLLVMDAQARRTTLLEPTGEFVLGHPWTASISPLLIMSDAYIVQEFSRTETATEMRVKAYDYEGKEIRNWGIFMAPEMKMITRNMGENMISIGVSIPYSPRSIFAGDPSGPRLYHCLNSAYAIEIYEGEGKLVRKIDRPYTPEPVTEKDKQEYLKRYDSSPQARELWEGMPFPSVKTVTENLFVDDRGFLWIATAETQTDGDRKLTTYDIFDTEGIYEARVRLDMIPGRVFADSRMYRLQEDPDTGLAHVTRYVVIWD